MYDMNSSFPGIFPYPTDTPCDPSVFVTAYIQNCLNSISLSGLFIDSARFGPCFFFLVTDFVFDQPPIRNSIPSHPSHSERTTSASVVPLAKLDYIIN